MTEQDTNDDGGDDLEVKRLVERLFFDCFVHVRFLWCALLLGCDLSTRRGLAVREKTGAPHDLFQSAAKPWSWKACSR